MKIYYVLCGNKYSEMLFEIKKIDSSITLIHRSNVRKLTQKLSRVFILLAAIVLRYLVVPFCQGKFVLVIPHLAGNYGFISNILNAHEFIIIDDGITFEYWSEFHNEYIFPLCKSTKSTLLVGPREPNWPVEIYKNIKIAVINRKIITEAILKNITPSVDYGKIVLINERTAWILDDGQMDLKLIIKIYTRIKAENKFNKINILWHPARNKQKEMDLPIQPAEVSILCANTKFNFVIGKASTVLFNIAAYNSNIIVASFPTGYSDLDQSALAQGILRINIEDYV